MEVMIMMYLILGGMTIFSLFAVLAVVAGRDILFAFYRRFNYKGNDVFIVTSNRQVEHHYLKPNDGLFKIKESVYLTNPSKLQSLDDEAVKQVKQNISIGQARVKGRIKKLEEKRDLLKREVDSVPKGQGTPLQLEAYRIKIEQLDNIVEQLKSKLNTREQAYFMQKRGAYFYIENDPIPKDFHEFITDLDSIELQNVISRAQSKDPKAVDGLQKDLSIIKKIVFVLLVALGIVTFLVWKNNSMLDQIGNNLGVVFSI